MIYYKLILSFISGIAVLFLIGVKFVEYLKKIINSKKYSEIQVSDVILNILYFCSFLTIVFIHI